MGMQLKNYKERNSYENLPLSFDVLQSELYTHMYTQTHTHKSEQRHKENEHILSHMPVYVHNEHVIRNLEN